MTKKSPEANTTTTTVAILGLVLLLAAACSKTMTVSEVRLRVLAKKAVLADGGYPSVRSHIFGPKAVFTGVMNAERFTEALGFWIFLGEPHREGTTPVVLVHGHSTGPRPFENLARSLSGTRFEPWFTFYATGTDLRGSAALLRRSLACTCRRFGVDRVAVVAYSMGGVVTRQALRPYADGIRMPAIPLVIAVSNPWGGSEETRFESERTFAPKSWDDIDEESPFIAHLFDDPLPEGTELHYIYGLGGEPDELIGEENDGILSRASLERPELLREATTVTLFEELGHVEIIHRPKTVERIGALLEDRLLTP